MLLANLAVLISFTECMVECDCSRLTMLFTAPYIPVAKNENEAKHSSAESTGSLHSVLNGMSQWVWPENKAYQSNVNVWCHMTCTKVIFEACHDPNIYYLLLYLAQE